MEILQLIYFLSVVETGSISKSADLNHVSQPNLSRSINKLEEELGFTLLNHQKGRISVNENGKIFAKYSKAALQTLDEGISRIKHVNTDSREKLVLCSTVHDINLIQSFVLSYPLIPITSYQIKHTEIENILINKQADFVITMLDPGIEGIAYKPLYFCEYVIIMKNNNPLAKLDIISWDDLKDEYFVLDGSVTNKQLFANVCMKNGFFPIIDHVVGDMDLLMSMVNNEIGISVIPILSYKDMKLKGRIPNDVVYRRFKDYKRDAHIGIAYRKDVPFSGFMQMFLDYVEIYFNSISEQYDKISAEQD